MYRPAVGMFSPVGAHTPRLCGSNTRKNTRTDFEESSFRDEIGKRLPPPIPPGALNVDNAPPLPPKHPPLVHHKGLETFNHCKKASESLDLACKDVYESISDSNLSSRASIPCQPYSREPTSQDLDTGLSFLPHPHRPEVVAGPTKTSPLCPKFQCPPTVSRSSGRDLSRSLCTCHLGSKCNVTSCTSKSYHNGESPIWSKMTTLDSEVGTRNPGSAHASYFSPSCTTVVTVCHPSDRPALSTVQPHFKDQPWSNRFDLAGSEPANLDKKAKGDANRSERPSTLTRFSRTLSRLFRLKSSSDRKISETPRSKSVYSSDVRENNRVPQAALPAKPKSKSETRHLSCTCHMQSSSSRSSGRLHRGRASGKSGSWTPVTTATSPLVVDHGSAALCYPHRYTEVSEESQRRSQPRSQQLVQSHHHQQQQQFPRSMAEQQQQSEVALLTPTAATVAPSGDCIHNCVHHIHHIHHVHHVHHHLHHMPLEGSALSEVAAAMATAAEGSGSRSPPPPHPQPPSAFLEGLPSEFTSSDAALVFQESRAAISSVVGNARPGSSDTKTSAAAAAAATRVCPRMVENPLTKGQLSELTSPVNLGSFVSHTYSAYGVRSHNSVTTVTTSHSVPSVTCTASASSSVAVPSALPHRQPSNICARGHCLVGARYHVKGPSDANAMNSELAVAAVAAAETGLVLNSPEVITGCCSAPLDSTGARLRSLSSSSPTSASAATATNSSSPWTAAQSRTLPLVASSSQKQQLLHRQVQHHMHHHHHVHHMATALASPSSRQGASPLSPCTATGRITRVIRPPSSSLPSTSHLCQSPISLATQADSVTPGSFCTSRCGTGSGNVGGGSSAVHASSPSPHSTTAVDHRSSFQESMKELRKMGWYWGPLSFTDAEVLLAKRPDGTFLVRDSGHDTFFLSLSFRVRGTTYHTRIEHNQGRFSFWYQPQTHSASTVVEFIEKAVAHSISGKFHYFLQTNTPGQNPVEVPLLYPLSRFQVVQSLKHLARFTILSHVRRDHVAKLPLPPGLIGYLLEKQVYWESLEEFEEFIRDRPPLHFVSCTSRSARALTPPPPPCSSPSPLPPPPPPASSSPGPLGLSSSPVCTTAATMVTSQLSRRPSPQPNNTVIPARASSGPT